MTLRACPSVLSKVNILVLFPIFVASLQLSASETILMGPRNIGRIRGDDSHHFEKSCDCRKLLGKNSFRHDRIYGGKPAISGQFPYQAKIELFNITGQNTFDHICGGVLISSSHVLTAAHCLASTGVDKGLYRVVLGDKKNQRPYKVRDFVKHRRVHAQAQNDNDIALLKIEDDWGNNVRCDNNVQPICLGGPTFPTQTNCQISGYGITEQETLSDRLLYATVELHSHQTCQKIHNELHRVNTPLRNTSFAIEHITPNMLCAGPLNGHYDACFGDSGGALSCYSKETQLTYLTGIASWGKACGIKPSVYTKVAQYKDWIYMEMQLMG